ncbi:MAG: carbohydrate binding family 9 domain-containing protein [bacterium]|nr:carbohydrate binding family 9 domain-containing protein [bacterium]
MTRITATPQAVRIFLFTTLLLIAGTASAQQADPQCDPTQVPLADVIRAERLGGPVELDGVLDDAAWQRPGETRHMQNDPDNGCLPRQVTEFWVAYDNSALYVAARLHDSAPDSISARLGRRDTWPSSDWLYINLDTFNDDRNAFSFSINPAGVLGDSKLYNDGWGDNSWDGVWEAATRIDELGWVAEVRIPFSQLKFPASEEQVWGMNLSRRTLRSNERTDLFHNPRGGSGYGKRFPDLVGISGIEPETSTEITPYLLGKGEFRDVDRDDPFASDPQFSGNAGVDFKTALSNNLTLNAAVNPDFGQVEVDPAVVNLGAYETFYEERRPFFVEDANTFRFGREGLNSNWSFNWMDPMLFYSRRVGRAPQLGIDGDYDFVDRPQVTTILGAAKVSGKVGNTSVGALSAFTAKEKAHLQIDGKEFEQVVEPFTNYSVVRAKVTKPDGTCGLGIMATSTIRDLDDPVSQAALDKRSFTGGIDGFTKLDEDGVWALKAYVAGSHITGSPEAIADMQTSSRRYFQRPDVDHMDYDPDATELKGWVGRAGVNKESGNWRFNSALGYSSPGFEINDVGFQYRTDMINASVTPGYSWREPHGIFRNQSLFLGMYKTWDTGGNPAEYGAGLFYWNQLKNYWSVDSSVFINPERNNPRLTRGGPMMRAPAYRSWDLGLSSDWRKNWVVSVSGGGSSDDGGSRTAFGRVRLEVHPMASLGLTVTPRYTWEQEEAQHYDEITDPAMTSTYGNRYIFADLEYRQFSLETRIDWTFSPKLTLQAYVQPLFAVGRYTDHKELARSSSFEFDRFGRDNGSSIVHDPAGDADNPYLVTPDGADPANTFRLADRDFNFKSLKVNMVLRWEYAAGSTFYLVWTQDRVDTQNPGDFDLGRDTRSLLDAQGEHILMVKISQYFSL